MSKSYRQVPFIFNYSTLFLLILAFVIARCKKNDNVAASPGAGRQCSVSLVTGKK